MLRANSDLLTAHSNYLAINQDARNRLADYREFFAGHLESE